MLLLLLSKFYCILAYKVNLPSHRISILLIRPQTEWVLPTVQESDACAAQLRLAQLLLRAHGHNDTTVQDVPAVNMCTVTKNHVNDSMVYFYDVGNSCQRDNLFCLSVKQTTVKLRQRSVSDYHSVNSVNNLWPALKCFCFFFFWMEIAKGHTDGECICSEMLTHFSDAKLHNLGVWNKGLKVFCLCFAEHIPGLQIKVKME